MVFASLTFLFIFLPLNLLLYYVSKNTTYRNILLTLFSFVFYAWGEPIWIVLLLFSAIFDYGNGLWIEKIRGSGREKYIVFLSVFVNLGLLVAFKYSAFLYDNLTAVIPIPFPRPENTLPIGISFYTFQTISYVVDVYRGEVKAQRKMVNFLLYVSSYHQLVAGPIVRYSHIAYEIANRKFNWDDITSGVQRFCFGLFKKVAIANVAGSFVDSFLISRFSELTPAEAWFGLLMFSVQIFFDFSGYSDMAIGLGRMFGFHYHENFRAPYSATSATDFWRRWHISLGTFFRDYVYIPLGGNKKNVYFNLAVVWALTGIWHGASWNFILWGCYFGALIMIEKLFLLKVLKAIPGIFSHGYALFIVIIGWALFYFTDLGKLEIFSRYLFDFSNMAVMPATFSIILRENIFWFILVVALCLPWQEWKEKYNWSLPSSVSPATQSFLAIASIALLIISTSFLVGKSYNPFLYFRF